MLFLAEIEVIPGANLAFHTTTHEKLQRETEKSKQASILQRFHYVFTAGESLSTPKNNEFKAIQ